VRFDAGFKDDITRPPGSGGGNLVSCRPLVKTVKIMDMYMSQNAIIITKVANGWAVQLPMTQKSSSGAYDY